MNTTASADAIARPDDLQILSPDFLAAVEDALTRAPPESTSLMAKTLTAAKTGPIPFWEKATLNWAIAFYAPLTDEDRALLAEARSFAAGRTELRYTNRATINLDRTYCLTEREQVELRRFINRQTPPVLRNLRPGELEADAEQRLIKLTKNRKALKSGTGMRWSDPATGRSFGFTVENGRVRALGEPDFTLILRWITREHDEASASAKRAAATARRRRVKKFDEVVELVVQHLSGRTVLTPGSTCRFCGKDLSDPPSVARAIGSDCWQGIRATAEALLRHDPEGAAAAREKALHLAEQAKA